MHRVRADALPWSQNLFPFAHPQQTPWWVCRARPYDFLGFSEASLLRELICRVSGCKTPRVARAVFSVGTFSSAASLREGYVLRGFYRPSLRAAAPLVGPGSNPAVEDLPPGPGDRRRHQYRRHRRHRRHTTALQPGPRWAWFGHVAFRSRFRPHLRVARTQTFKFGASIAYSR